MFASIKRSLATAGVVFAMVGAAPPAMAMGGGPGAGPYSGSFNLNSYRGGGGFPSGGYVGEGDAFRADHGDAGIPGGHVSRHRRHGGSGDGGNR